MRRLVVAIAFSSLLAPARMLPAATVARRFLVAAGSNRGAWDRAPLRYAISDAESFARLMEEMGGVAPSDGLVLHEPTRKVLQDALQAVRIRTAASHETDVRYEVVFYYSGHADEKGLLLGTESLPYQSLRQWMDGLQADLRIAILDGCASGAITRIKGGRRQKAFMIDESSNLKGYAFLTSSTEHESAQESERLKGSFFTHYLMTGMRGAADVSGDGRVTISEAYQFAFQETMVRTARTQGGTQHPAYDMNLAGTGDVVMTDLRQTSSQLILSAELTGRLFVRSDKGQFVAELQKAAGKTVELGLEPGTYLLDLQRPPQLLSASVELKEDEKLVLKPGLFQPASTEPTTLRGEQEPEPAPPVARPVILRPSRIDLALTVWPGSGNTSSTGTGTVTTGNRSSGGGTLSYWRLVHPALALGVAFSAGRQQSDVELAGTGVFTRSSTLFSITPAARYYPLKAASASVSPFITAGVGPYFKHEGDVAVAAGVSAQTQVRTVVGGFAGGGLDVRLSGRTFLYTDAIYHRIAEFKSASGAARQCSGMSFSVGIGFRFGKAVGARRPS